MHFQPLTTGAKAGFGDEAMGLKPPLLLILQGAASPSLRNYGGVGLDHVGGHVRAPAKPRESGVHDGGRAHDQPCKGGPRIPCASRGYVMVYMVFYERGFSLLSH
jgi:hypothetical protein